MKYSNADRTPKDVDLPSDRSCESKLDVMNSLTITIVTPGIGHSFKTPVEKREDDVRSASAKSRANGFGLLPSTMGEEDQALEGGEEKGRSSFRDGSPSCQPRKTQRTP